MNKKCVGCGSILQFDNVNDIGYIPKNKYENSSYCQRCYKIKYYNQKTVTRLENVNEMVLKKVNKKPVFVYFLIDFLNISQEVIDIYNKIDTDKCFVISKVDTIPTNIKNEKVIKKLREIYGIKEEIILLSSLKNLNTKAIIWRVKDLGYDSCYILGYANSGKSSLINKLCEVFNKKKHGITTSSVPNTTVDFIKIQLEDLTIYDSPGFVLNKYFYAEGEFELIKRCSPKPPINPVTYQVKDKESILIEDRIRIFFNSNNSAIFYLSNLINIKKVFSNNNILKNEKSITINVPKNSDLIIKGLGFINIKNECKIEIYALNKDIFEIRNSIFD